MKTQPEQFGVYICYRMHPIVPRAQKVIVLAVDFQAALSTVPDAFKIERIDDLRTPIVINKAVLKMFKDRTEKRKK